MYAPFGKCFRRSSGWHNFFSIDGLWTRALRAAEAIGLAIFSCCFSCYLSLSSFVSVCFHTIILPTSLLANISSPALVLEISVSFLLCLKIAKLLLSGDGEE